MAAFTALYDACVLYPAPLRDLLMGLAGTGLFRARWTDAIRCILRISYFRFTRATLAIVPPQVVIV